MAKLPSSDFPTLGNSSPRNNDSIQWIYVQFVGREYNIISRALELFTMNGLFRIRCEKTTDRQTDTRWSDSWPLWRLESKTEQFFNARIIFKKLQNQDTCYFTFESRKSDRKIWLNANPSAEDFREAKASVFYLPYFKMKFSFFAYRVMEFLALCTSSLSLSLSRGQMW